MYKDKDRQRHAVKEAVRRHRARCNTQANVIPCNTPDVIPNILPKPEPQSYNPMMAGYVPPRPEQNE